MMMDAGSKQRVAEALVHMSYGRAYSNALQNQADVNAPESRKTAAAAMLAERASTSMRDPSAVHLRDASAGRTAMEQAYGSRASDVSAVLSGRVASYDLPKGFGGTADMSALTSKSQILVQQANMDGYASRGRVSTIGTGNNYLDRHDDRAATPREKLVSHMLHVKSAIESAVDRKEFDRSQADMLYQRFQKGSYDLGSNKQSNADYGAYEKANTPRLQQDVAKEVEARYEAQRKVVARAKEKEADPANVAKAEAFRTMAPQEAIKKHPDLAGAYVAMAATVKEASAGRNMSEENQKALIRHVHERTAQSIEQGVVPEVKRTHEVTTQQNKGVER